MGLDRLFSTIILVLSSRFARSQAIDSITAVTVRRTDSRLVLISFWDVTRPT